MASELVRLLPEIGFQCERVTQSDLIVSTASDDVLTRWCNRSTGPYLSFNSYVPFMHSDHTFRNSSTGIHALTLSRSGHCNSHVQLGLTVQHTSPHNVNMAPGLVEPQSQSPYNSTSAIAPKSKSGSVHNYVPGRTVVKQHNEPYEHEDLLPGFPEIKWSPYKDIPYIEKGNLGDTNFKHLLADATDVFDYNSKIGTEIHGVDLANLTDLQKNDLARLISTRGVVFFRNQKNLTIDKQRELGQCFGSPAHARHHRGATTRRFRRPLFTQTFHWHSDVTYETQPPSYTSLKLLTAPPPGAGGDTIWSSQYAAYDMLSPALQTYLESLTALHSADLQTQGTRALGRAVRRDPITTEHPLIRTNPVTGSAEDESDFVIALLNQVVATSPEVQVRFRWGEGDVAFWDNRCTNHSASYGFAPHRRHAVCVAVQAERPVLDPQSKSQEEDLSQKFGVLRTSKDGSGVVKYND
ncbi:hypothetical protein LEMA_P035020.1 [Plenodomus lingam JN3]|uniref:TauD/TfdA-like domain-containing protein n=1 Tax=Leptosphaeria maculans (strain JN3 / isolate v23.1.3 / race Av1-4-5-6-7-8) TaxID=985895 RepID=E4ZRI1_LEPMJ|nr:hypothetical protein LEMA_P035020.1 [Plenodomus lingam JN3]CBX93828.1 hypothetical protein LEMA_P035020.1 [Plenodomus lingam JN3]